MHAAPIGESAVTAGWLGDTPHPHNRQGPPEWQRTLSWLHNPTCRRCRRCNSWMTWRRWLPAPARRSLQSRPRRWPDTRSPTSRRSRPPTGCRKPSSCAASRKSSRAFRWCRKSQPMPWCTAISASLSLLSIRLMAHASFWPGGTSTPSIWQSWQTVCRLQELSQPRSGDSSGEAY